MLKQKITQFREYRVAKKEAEKQETVSQDCFRAWMDALGAISTTRQKSFLNAVRKPHDGLFGTVGYPCIISHRWEISGYAFGHEIYESDSETHHCSYYIEKSLCPMKHCYWYKKNHDAAIAWAKYQTAENASKQAAEKFKNAYRALFGERRYQRVYGK